MKKLVLPAILFLSCCFNCYSQNSVADIEFGKTSYEEAVPKLNYRFGEPVLDNDEGRIAIYENVTYAGFFFDRVWFAFESTTSRNVFNKCWMLRNFRTAEEAKKFRDKVAVKLGEKYNVEQKINPETKFKEYFVGTSPTDPTKPYIVVSTHKFGNSDYTTGVSYGPFEYFKESF